MEEGGNIIINSGVNDTPLSGNSDASFSSNGDHMQNAEAIVNNTSKELSLPKADTTQLLTDFEGPVNFNTDLTKIKEQEVSIDDEWHQVSEDEIARSTKNDAIDAVDKWAKSIFATYLIGRFCSLFHLFVKDIYLVRECKVYIKYGVLEIFQ